MSRAFVPRVHRSLLPVYLGTIFSAVVFSSGLSHADLLKPAGAPAYRHSPIAPVTGIASFPESRVIDVGQIEQWLGRSIMSAGKWTGGIETTLRKFLEIEMRNLMSPCNVFLGKALKLLYGIRDFEFADAPGKYLEANDIARYVERHPEEWMLLGSASNQATLERAQTFANLLTPVIAVYAHEPHGHVAVVLPGMLEYSGQWNLHVPNSASMFLNQPYKSYVGLSLSNAFQASRIPKVKIYVRAA